MQSQKHYRGWFIIAALAAALAGGLIGCAGQQERLIDRPERPKADRTLSAMDFYDGAAKAVPTAASHQASAEEGSAAAPVVATSEGGAAPDSGPDAPPESVPAAVSHAGLVGQVNGRPIYVADFFAPIEDQLRIWGGGMTRLEFATRAFPYIQEQLAGLITRELVYSEAEASLTENERVGLRYFLQQLESDVTRNRGRVGQEQYLREERGLGVDEVIELERRKQLITYKIQSEIRKRVIISWRDVERYYRDHHEEFNPPASIQLRILTVKAGDAAIRREIEQSLSEGYLFSALAEQYSTMLAGRGGLLDPTPLTRGLAETAITRWPEVDELARTLKEGEDGGPVTVGDLSIWTYVENLDDGQGRTLYDVQHEIENRLFEERIAAEEKRYLAELFARGNMDDFTNMAYLLLDIAIQRWARPE